jgi:hypothetical protein
MADERSQLFERDLFEIRSRISEIIKNAERKHLGRKQRKKSKKDEEGDWKVGEDVDKLCAVFTNFLTSPANFQHYSEANADKDSQGSTSPTNKKKRSPSKTK